MRFPRHAAPPYAMPLCWQGGGTARMNANPGALAGVLGAGEMVFAADSTVRKQATFEGMRETLAITLLAAPEPRSER